MGWFLGFSPRETMASIAALWQAPDTALHPAGRREWPAAPWAVFPLLVILNSLYALPNALQFAD